MSGPQDCSACIAGDHPRHNATEGSRPGLIGGTVCECKGECGDQRTRDLLWEIFGDKDVPPAVSTIPVCRWCRSASYASGEHGVSIPAGPEDGDVGCFWPCGHTVARGEDGCGFCTAQAPF